MLCAVLLGLGTPAGAAVRDDTDLLQAKVDAGGAIFLPKLPNGACYRSRGLWLSNDDTTISSDGACIVPLGFKPWLADLGSITRTFVLATIAVPIVIYGLMPRLQRLRARILTRATA